MRMTCAPGNLLIAVLLLLSACIGQQTKKFPIGAWQVRRSELLAIQDWSFQGKLALKSDRGNANLKVGWTQHREKYELILTGPLGQVLIKVYGENGKVTLVSAGSEPVSSEDAESLIYENWGWQLPVSQMPFWVRGIPAPDFPHQADYNSDGSLRQLRQLGWEIRFLKYQEQLPVRLEMLTSEISLLLVVKEWHMPGSSNDR